MIHSKLYRVVAVVLIASVPILFPAVAMNQSPPAKPQSQSPADDVIRVNTELVQTDVTVVDKKGRLVDQLTAGDFELIVEGKPQEIAFFERVVASRANNELTASGAAASGTSSAVAAARVRTVMFFVDDLHLSAASLEQTRKALLDFVTNRMEENDQVAITSASGQIGFLQQFTDDRTVLQSAVARLSYRANSKFDMEQPPMSEFIASRIQDGDESTITYYVNEMMKQNCFKTTTGVVCMMDTRAARNLVVQRAREMTLQSSPETKNTLIMLEGLMRTAAQLPGRKLLFLVSDGFYLNDRQTGSLDRIKKITDAAGRAGVVIYTLDARGIANESLDATNDRPLDSEGLTGVAQGSIAASQEGLNALARDTGGQAFRNTNRPMGEWIKQVVEENSTYYVLAWRPQGEEQKRRRFKNIQIRVKGRPDLTTRMRRGYFRTTPLPLLTIKGKPEKGLSENENDMRRVIDTPVAQREITARLNVSLTPMPGVGTKVLATVEIDRRSLAFDLFDGKPAADVDIGGIFYDDNGKPKSSFVGRLRIAAPDSSGPDAPALYRFQAWLPAGLYQVRVGLRDTRSGKMGSAEQWIKVPR